MSTFDRLRRAVILPTLGGILLAGAPGSCVAPGDCLRYSDCAQGLTCANGHCVIVPAGDHQEDGGVQAGAEGAPSTLPAEASVVPAAEADVAGDGSPALEGADAPTE